MVAPRLDALNGTPGVVMVDNSEDFIEAVVRSLASQAGPSNLDPFLKQNSWEARVRALLEFIELADQKEKSPQRGDSGEARTRNVM